jgi:hypothetical protein
METSLEITATDIAIIPRLQKSTTRPAARSGSDIHMVDDSLMSASEVSEYLGITIMDLRQIQHRKQLCWVSRVGR